MWNTIGICLLQLLTACALYPFGMQWMLRAFVAINIGWLFIWFRFVHLEIGLMLKDMLKDIAPYLGLSALLTIGTHYLTRNIENLYLSMGTKIVTVAALYALILWRLKSVIFKESIQFLLKKKIV